jgi:Na+-translocating ferredoxin:NAD+ oxidoreductase RnfC subunit|tara:strand:+ start:176 stop:382 length:207 start_codon:yes stop_codon:yes gene_type:complete
MSEQDKIEMLALKLLGTGDKRSISEVLGKDASNMSSSKILNALKKKGIKGFNKGGIVAKTKSKFKGHF